MAAEILEASGSRGLLGRAPPVAAPAGALASYNLPEDNAEAEDICLGGEAACASPAPAHVKTSQHSSGRA